MKWITLIYKLPKFRTTAKKLAIWRKLKRLGVYSLQDSVFVLPCSERTLENFEWLAEEIKEMGGEVTLWEMKSLDPVQDERVNAFFLEQVNAQYRNIIDTAPEIDSVKKLQSQWALFHRIKAQDYLKSPLWLEAKKALEDRAAALARS